MITITRRIQLFSIQFIHSNKSGTPSGDMPKHIKKHITINHK